MMHLKPTLSSLLSDAPSGLSIKDFASLCHKMAVVYLRKKDRNPAFCGLSLDDLASDCIADLFQRDERGVFVKLASYFSAPAWESKSEDELLGATRRLVFSQVNQALYRIYRETDPSLGKLLRNLKNAVKSSSLVTLVQRQRETWICLNQENGAAASLPAMPPEFLEAHLTASLRGEADLKQILAVLIEILNDQHDYRKSYPLTGLALIIRSAFTHLNTALEQENNGHDNFAAAEIEKMVAASVQTVKAKMRPAYVEKQKIHAEAYDLYFLAIHDMLAAEYVQNDGCNRSYFDYLRQHLELLTREEYQKRFRCHFEYLAKLTRQELLHQFKKKW
jgi:hypothetical protein